MFFNALGTGEILWTNIIQLGNLRSPGNSSTCTNVDQMGICEEDFLRLVFFTAQVFVFLCTKYHVDVRAHANVLWTYKSVSVEVFHMATSDFRD